MELNHIDGRRQARERYAGLLDQFQILLGGPEEPCHQFIKAHPELISPSHDAAWSKVPFGGHVSDFVFREPYQDYLLVEIEAPYRELFRKDGHPRHDLNHAISQILDWIGYIENNKAKVESELGLAGISSSPRALVVIGRSASLTEGNRRSLAVLQARHARLTILTYDDVLDRARAHLERQLGPMSLKTQNIDMYYYREGQS